MAEALAGVTGTITVDLGQIANNWRRLATRVAPAECGAVVKADAYGLGVARVVPALLDAGCKVFFVATPDEGLALRAIAPAARIYILNGPLGAAATLAEHGLRPVISTLDDCEAVRDASQTLQRPVAVALHLDSGLNRLGLSAADTRILAGREPLRDGLAISLIMSHLASADIPRDPKNPDQLLAFETLSALFPDVRRSLAASDGLLLGPAYHFDLVRPGYALYGGQASRTMESPVDPVVTVRARILSVVDVGVGETVGYSGVWRAERTSRIATLSAGYADGIPRSASTATGTVGGKVLIADQLAPMVGRVSMDLITVDVTDLDPQLCRAGMFATLIGDGLTLEDAGYASSTIGYEILTRLGSRFKRLYLDA